MGNKLRLHTPLHPIEKYVTETDTTFKAFSDLLGISYQALWGYRTGNRVISKHMKKMISLVSKGKILAEEL